MAAIVHLEIQMKLCVVPALIPIGVLVFPTLLADVPTAILGDISRY